jgi:O-antigen/teichoic acid export membrane protein
LKELRKNLSYRLLEAIFTTAVLLVQNALLAKHLSVQDYGTYSLGMLWSLIIIILSYGFSIPTLLARELCQRQEQSRVVSNIFLLQFIISIFILIVFLFSFLNLEYFRDLNNSGFLLYVTGSLILAAPISMQGILSSKEAMGTICLIKVAAFSLNLLALFVILELNLGLSWVFLSHLIMAVVFAYGFYFGSQTKDYLFINEININELKYSYRESSFLVLIVLFAQLYSKVDLIMIDMLAGKTEVAIYSSAYRLFDYLLIIASALAIAIFPNLMKLAKEPAKFWSLYTNFTKLLVYGLFPISCLIAMFSKSILTLLYGSVYADGSISLQILMAASCLAFLSAPFASVFIAFKQQKIYLIATVLALLMNVLGNMLLIPIYSHEGAAISTLITELTLLLFCFFKVKQLRQH